MEIVSFGIRLLIEFVLKFSRCQKGAMNVHTIPLKGKCTKVLLRFERAPGGAGAASKHGASIVQPYCIAVGSEFFCGAWRLQRAWTSLIFWLLLRPKSADGDFFSEQASLRSHLRRLQLLRPIAIVFSGIFDVSSCHPPFTSLGFSISYRDREARWFSCSTILVFRRFHCFFIFLLLQQSTSQLRAPSSVLYGRAWRRQCSSFRPWFHSSSISEIESSSLRSWYKTQWLSQFAHVRQTFVTSW